MNIQHLVQKSQGHIAESLKSQGATAQRHREDAIKVLDQLTSQLKITDYLLIDSKPSVSKTTFIESHFNLGTLYKTNAEFLAQAQGTMSEHVFSYFMKAVKSFNHILAVAFEHDSATKQIISIYTQLCFWSQQNLEKCLQFLKEALFFDAANETIHYNLGFVYQKMNKLESSITHYKLSLHLCQLAPTSEETKRLMLNNYNGMSCVYRSIKKWPEALFYLQKAERIKPTDPDVQNQLGVVYTEMRRTDLADISYKKAMQFHTKSFITADHMSLKAEVYLNHGHMHAYNGNNTAAIECYNKSLQVSPKFTLPFQNKLMNLSYIFDQLEDKQYIFNQHLLVNKLYKKATYQFPPEYFATDKINIGIVSGDFADHPVSYFISTFLQRFDPVQFNVTCYSECVINVAAYSKDLKFKFIKSVSAEEAARTIRSDNIHILFDLAGHTALNRLDIFALKPCPVQITYIGYPYTTGLHEMDYRITDAVCDDAQVSQPMYTEKLLFMPNCFLCYNGGTAVPPALEPQPCLALQGRSQPYKGVVKIGCFNRLNKITDTVIKVFNDILHRFDNVQFVFKTKALLNAIVKEETLNKFDAAVRDRITVLDCTISHEEHLLQYNSLDLAIDTFPYSGTTTSCESLYMGVPVFTLYDDVHYFHAQNVTASLLKNSGLEFYIVQSKEQLLDKLADLLDRDTAFWKDLKTTTRQSFLDGDVCNQSKYMKNFTEMLTNIHEKHSTH